MIFGARVARALVSKGINLGELGRHEDAIVAYDDVIARCGTAAEPALREQVGRALVHKGIDLGRLGRREEAIAACDDVIVRFGKAEEPALKGIISRPQNLRISLKRKSKKSKR